MSLSESDVLFQKSASDPTTKHKEHPDSTINIHIMDPCSIVEKEVERVLSKFGEISKHGSHVLGDLINHITNLRTEFDNAPQDMQITPVQIEILKDTIKKVKETVSRLGSEHRDIHSAVSKVGKAIDRNFTANFAYTSNEEDCFSTPEKAYLINQIIYQHFCQIGMHEVAEALASETSIHMKFDADPFKEINYILDNLKKKHSAPALKWAQEHHTQLEELQSALEFKLHRLEFVELLRKGIEFQTEAIHYARKHFNQFVPRHERAIQTAMGLLLFVPNGIDTSPYRDLILSDMWVEIYEVFTRDACTILGISIESPLATCINAGCMAVPALLNIKQVMLKRHVNGVWNGKDELPIEIDIGADKRYHSMFACPILRQQATDANPPMRLVCGHVISKDALSKLSNSNKMKCPYCPLEQNPSDARLIYF